jgi:hypothetical protein
MSIAVTRPTQLPSQAALTLHPPPYSLKPPAPSGGDIGDSSQILSGLWDLACTIEPSGPVLYRDVEGKATWSYDPAMTPTPTFDQQQDIKITNQGRSWLCPTNSRAGQALKSQFDKLSMRRVGEQLVIFELSTVPKPTDLFAPDPSDDGKGVLEVEDVSIGVWYISGARIFQIEGDEQAFVIQSSRYIRLYDLQRKTMLWEKCAPLGSQLFGQKQIFCLNGSYVVAKYGKYHLLKRSNGDTYGKFDLPHGQVESVHERDRFGPLVSSSGLVLYRPSAEILYIFCIEDKKVEYRIWESETRIQGSLVLRGNLETLQLRFVDTFVKEHRRRTEKVYKTSLIDKLLGA